MFLPVFGLSGLINPEQTMRLSRTFYIYLKLKDRNELQRIFQKGKQIGFINKTMDFWIFVTEMFCKMFFEKNKNMNLIRKMLPERSEFAKNENKRQQDIAGDKAMSSLHDIVKDPSKHQNALTEIVGEFLTFVKNDMKLPDHIASVNEDAFFKHQGILRLGKCSMKSVKLLKHVPAATSSTPPSAITVDGEEADAPMYS
jgi:hypothetical protein